MLSQFLILSMLLQAPQASAAQDTTSTQPANKTLPTKTGIEADDTNTLLKVKRIYVDSFGDDVTSKELQSMIVTALVNSKRFKVTENKERADAILRGVALEKTSQELHAYGEGTSVGAASGGHSATVGGSGGTFSGSSNGGFIAKQMGISDSSVNTETINEARIAVRLVNPDGDVIWTSTQESKGAKYKSSSADVADQCVKDLLRTVEKLEKTNATHAPATGATPAGSDAPPK